MQMHRQEDRGMFSQCFCELATQVAEMLCQHLSLLDSKKMDKRNKRKECERERERFRAEETGGLRKFTRTEKKLQ